MTSTGGDGPSQSINDSVSDEPSSKRIKLEQPTYGAAPLAPAAETPATREFPVGLLRTGSGDSPTGAKPGSTFLAVSTGDPGESEIVTCSDNSQASGSNTSFQDNSVQVRFAAGSSCPTPNPTGGISIPPPPPPKATTMRDLKMKYLEELEYMLREFRKLERQLLGAKGAAKLEESAGSRERREKLNSFILHLEETVQQIEEGCALELERDASGATTQRDEATRTEDEENVQRLDDHILSNLLPVKIRLKKQLAAQQGATKNPPGMPAPRRGSLQPTNLGKGTFVAAAEERRKQAEAAQLAAQEKEQTLQRVSEPSQFGKPLGGGGSSLTQKLHGATLGSTQRTYGHGVGSSIAAGPQTDEATPRAPKILYAGMVPQSTQHKSSLNAASGVHELLVQDPNFMDSKPEIGEADSKPQVLGSVAPAPQDAHQPAALDAKTKGNLPVFVPTTENLVCTVVPSHSPESVDILKKQHEDINISEDERRKLRKKRRKRKLMRLANRREKERQIQVAAQQAQAAQGASKPAAGRKKSAASKPPSKKGPKAVEYMCALCSETYTSTCDYNPWWALAQHECPKCRKMQIPRIDISAPANAIDYHPALLAHADENNGGGSSATAAVPPTPTVQVVHVAQPAATFTASSSKDQTLIDGLDSESDSELSELSDDSLSDDSLESDDDDDESLDFQAMSQAEQAEHESFGDDYTGPVLSDEDASRMLILMAHASTCPCQHKLTRHREICRSAKFMMLHVRDCPGTTASFDVCPFPWCRKVKHLLYHLVSCTSPETCRICSPSHLSESLKNLAGLNKFRAKKHRQKMIAALKAKNAAAKAKGAPTSDTCPTTQRTAQKKSSDVARARPMPTSRPAVPSATVITANASLQPTQTQLPETSMPGVKMTGSRTPSIQTSSVHSVPPLVKTETILPLEVTRPIPVVKEEHLELNSIDAKNASCSESEALPTEPLFLAHPGMAMPTLVPTLKTHQHSQSDIVVADGSKAPVSTASTVLTSTAPSSSLPGEALVASPRSIVAGSQGALSSIPAGSVQGSDGAKRGSDIPTMSYVPADCEKEVDARGATSSSAQGAQFTGALAASPAPLMSEPLVTPPDVSVGRTHLGYADSLVKTESLDLLVGLETPRMSVQAETMLPQMGADEEEDEISMSNTMASHPSNGALKMTC